jgi:urease accessory protein
MKQKLFFSAATLIAMTGLAEAHAGHSTAGFAYGFAHPFTGIDHIVTMVAVGLFAAMLGGKSRYLVPISFVAMMIAGAVLAFNGFALPFAETGIVASIIVLSAAVVLRWNVSVSLAMGLCGFFAVFHGFAHGAEMPYNLNGFEYGAGFTTATIMLQAAGLAAGLFAGWKAPKAVA